MNIQTYDTNSSAEKVQLDLLRQASVAERFSLARSLSRTVIRLSRRAIARANPQMNEDEVNLQFISLHYGSDLADRLRDYLKRGKA
ncbi:MAG: hypothetical protein V1789_06280 [PVC group bacterium]